MTERVADIIEEIAPRLLAQAEKRPPAPADAPTDMERRLLACMTEEPQHIDPIIARAGVTAPQALGLLLSLEIKGWVRQLPGKHFVSNAGSSQRMGG